MAWNIFTGTGQPRASDQAWRAIPDPPPWRAPSRQDIPFVPQPELLEAVNAALHLRRPLLLTGLPGSGKSTLVNVIAREFQLGKPLQWHITSRSTLTDSLYQYDALARLHSTQMTDGAEAADVQQFITLGPLGTALATRDHPRAVLIDEIDKSDLDLPGDLLHVLELNEFAIPPLVRDSGRVGERQRESPYRVRGTDGAAYDVPADGVITGMHVPVIVMTSNGERTFPPPFLRRCVRFNMPIPEPSYISAVVAQHLGGINADQRKVIGEFAARLAEGQILALDQILNLIYLLTGEVTPGDGTESRIIEILLAELAGP